MLNYKTKLQHTFLKGVFLYSEINSSNIQKLLNIRLIAE